MKLATAIFSAGIALFSPYLLAEDVYVATTGTKQGAFVGELHQKGLEGKVQAIGFSHEIISPRDAATGQATAKRQHKPITITKRVGASSPMFFAALTTNEVLKNVTIDFVDVVPQGGQRSLVYQIVLQNAGVSRIAQRLEDPAASGSKTVRYLEEISFVYQSIAVNSIASKRSASDSLSAP